jgi:hypothetical protein
MRIKELRNFAQGVGIGAAGLMIAFCAASFFLRPGVGGLVKRPSPLPRSAPAARKVLAGPESLPSNYLDLCRAAGL